MRTIIIGLAAAALLTGCSGGGEATNNAAEEAPADTLQPGEYELSFTVDRLKSTDKTTPATKSKTGSPAVVTRTCVPAGGTIEPKAFVEAAESCVPIESYMSRGRMNLQFRCTRPEGQLTQMVDGDFKADSFTADVTTATYFGGDGDYELRRKLTARRVGDCPAAKS